MPPKPLQRFYLAIPFTDRGRNGPPSAEAGFVLTPLPEPPAAVLATYTPTGTAIAWEPSGGLTSATSGGRLAGTSLSRM